MPTPVYRHSPDDPDRTDLIPRTGRSGRAPAWRPGPPNRPDGPPPNGMPPGGFHSQYGPAGVEPIYQETGIEPTPTGGRRRRARKRPLWKELLTLAAVALLMTFLIQHFLGRVYSIPSGSMEKTLHGCTDCDSDSVLVDKFTYAFTDPEPGDVVVFEGPDPWTLDDDQAAPDGNFFTDSLQQIGSLVGLAPPDERDFIKRVIAVGGQTVECCDNKGRVLVDGRPLDEPYIYWNNGKPDNGQRFDPVVVPQDGLWVMGDNRNNSKDSRVQGGGGLRGVVPIDNVIGKARSVVLPVSRWQGIGDHNPQGDTPVALGMPVPQQGLPAGLGIIAALPVLWLGRRIRALIRPPTRD